MNRRLDWEIRNAGETNTSVVKVRNTLDKNLAKLEEDTLGAPATMLVNFFWVSQLILKIHAWAVPKMPLFGENGYIWPIYQPSKLKSRFLGTSFSRLTFFKVRRGPCLVIGKWLLYEVIQDILTSDPNIDTLCISRLLIDMVHWQFLMCIPTTYMISQES